MTSRSSVEITYWLTVNATSGQENRRIRRRTADANVGGHNAGRHAGTAATAVPTSQPISITDATTAGETDTPNAKTAAMAATTSPCRSTTTHALIFMRPTACKA